jgi:DNA-binding GntR family transcriptional regulator
VAAALLARAGEGGGGASRFTVTDMAAAADTDWKTVRLALQMLQSEGAVRLERHRIFVRQDLLRKAAGSPAPAD